MSRTIVLSQKRPLKLLTAQTTDRILRRWALVFASNVPVCFRFLIQAIDMFGITVDKAICDILVGRQDVTQRVTLPCLKVYVDRTKTATQVGGDAHSVVVGKADADEGIVVVGDRI